MVINASTAESAAPTQIMASTTDTPATTNPPNPATDTNAPNEETANTLSKNQLKKLRRKEKWEGRRDDRRARRKEKRQDARARKRDAWNAAAAEAQLAGLDPKVALAKAPKPPSVQVPVSIILDCSFDAYMSDKEIVSLSSQIVRSYSENRNALYRAHMLVSSWGGRLQRRFEEGLSATHKHWKCVNFVEGDLGDAAARAREIMSGPERGEEIDTLKPREGEPAIRHEAANGAPAPEDPATVKDVVYLSSESPYVLDRLEPNTCYVVGGLVDKNREKGLCFRLAKERGVRTAKLPIGEYMVLQSRQVLATNHVVEIMMRWLECGDWGKAFLSVIPKRKGGRLKDEASAAGSAEPEEVNGAEEAEEADKVENDDIEAEEAEEVVEQAVSSEEHSDARPVI